MPDITSEQAMQMALEHHRAGRLAEAEALYRQVLQANPREPDALQLLGLIAHQSGHHGDAVTLMRRALDVGGERETVLNNLAAVLLEQNDVDQALEYARRAIALNANSAAGQRNLGQALLRKRRLSEAEAALRRAIALGCGDAVVLNHLGAALLGQEQRGEAIDAFRRAIELQPGYPPAHFNLGRALLMAGEPDEAEVAFERLKEIAPHHPFAISNLAGVYQERGEIDRAIECYREAQKVAPDARHESNIVYLMHFNSRYGGEEILAAHRDWADRHAKPFTAAIAPHENDRSRTRRLRIGYVSPDFRQHAVGRFLLPLMEHHDHDNFEIVCFSNVVMADATTRRFKTMADQWHETPELSDDALAALLRREKIDILIDLSLHMAGNRMQVFARKPAPVQVTYLAYASTSGLPTMDYRFTDEHLDPPGEDANYVERSLRLKSYWCFAPMGTNSTVTKLPASSRRHVTFGCLNSFAKASSEVLATWSQVLDAVPGSRMIMYTPLGSARRRVAEILGASRVDFVGFAKFDEYLRTYDGIDIALDTFPYGGGTTTCDALWMGVPVVTLRGKTAVGRGGASLLHQIRLPELIARDAGEYVQIAAELAGVLPRLALLREQMRERMLTSPLCDAKAFARDVESNFRWMWQHWCDREQR